MRNVVPAGIVDPLYEMSLMLVRGKHMFKVDQNRNTSCLHVSTLLLLMFSGSYLDKGLHVFALFFGNASVPRILAWIGLHNLFIGTLLNLLPVRTG